MSFKEIPASGDESLPVYERQFRVTKMLAGIGPVNQLPVGYMDAVHVDVTTKLGFWDRLKVLVGRPIHIDTRTLAENTIGHCYTDRTRVWVERLIPQKPKGGFAVVTSPEPNQQFEP